MKKTTASRRSAAWKSNLSANLYLYILLFPAIAYYIVFAYLPMGGSVLAFKEFSYSTGIWNSPWVGLKYFEELWVNSRFWEVVRNTVLISFGRIVFEFPIPILIALMLNEIRRSALKRFYQTVFTFPHFLSWVIVSGVLINLLSDAGVLNQLIALFGGDNVNLLTQPSTFKALLFLTDSWKEAGWGTIIYLATIAGINSELYEAASVDGANRFQLARHITWPGLQTVIGIMLILAIANIMNGGFDQVFNLYNPTVYDTADIIDTYIYRMTFMAGANFSLSTAFGLFKSVIAIALLYSANKAVRKMTGSGIY